MSESSGSRKGCSVNRMIEPGGTSRYTPEVEQRLLHGLVTALQPNEVTQRGDVDAVDGATVPNGDEVQVGDLPATYTQIDPSQDTSHALRVHHTLLFLTCSRTASTQLLYSCTGTTM